MAKILIIDDSAVARKALRNIFEKMECRIFEAACAIEGIRMFHNLKPDLITMDIYMPDLSGIEAVQRIMLMDPSSKIIMVSGTGKEDMVVNAIKSGAKGYIVKPFDETKVASVILKVLNS